MTAPDVDRDLLEAGAREAAEALMRLSRRTSGRLVAAGREPLSAVVGRTGPRVVVIGFSVSGGVAGRFALVASEESARSLAADMVGAAMAEKLGKRAVGALTELGNIAASAFMNGAADLLQVTCVPSVPTYAHDDAAKAVPEALGGVEDALVARLSIGDIDVELALTRAP